MMIAARNLSSLRLRSVASSRNAIRSLSFLESGNGANQKDNGVNFSALAAAGAAFTLTATSNTNEATLMEESKKPSSARGWNPFRKNNGEAEGGEAPSKKSSSSKIHKIAKHKDISVYKKGNRLVYLVGATNYSTESAELCRQAVQQIQPQALFVDINEKVFFDYGIYDGVMRVEKEYGVVEGINTKLKVRTEDLVEGDLPEIKDLSKQSMFAKWTATGPNPVQESVNNMFSSLKHAGLQDGAEKSNSGAHYHLSMMQAHKLDAYIILGAREFQLAKDRSDEAMEKSDVELSKSCGIEWNPSLTEKENYRAVAQEFERCVPNFHQVTFVELDQHMAKKIDKMDRFDTMVVVLMMIHVHGVEEFLKKQGWVNVSA